MVLFDDVIKVGTIQIWTPDGYFYWQGYNPKITFIPPKVDIDCHVTDLYGGELDGTVYLQIWQYGSSVSSNPMVNS